MLRPQTRLKACRGTFAALPTLEAEACLPASLALRSSCNCSWNGARAPSEWRVNLFCFALKHGLFCRHTTWGAKARQFARFTQHPMTWNQNRKWIRCQGPAHRPGCAGSPKAGGKFPITLGASRRNLGCKPQHALRKIRYAIQLQVGPPVRPDSGIKMPSSAATGVIVLQELGQHGNAIGATRRPLLSPETLPLPLGVCKLTANLRTESGHGLLCRYNFHQNGAARLYRAPAVTRPVAPHHSAITPSRHHHPPFLCIGGISAFSDGLGNNCHGLTL